MYILPLTALKHSDLPRAGGKGANLGEMFSAGLPVPPGFCILTSAYQDFVTENGLEKIIAEQCGGLDDNDPAALEAASAAIREQFEAGRMSHQLADELGAAYINFWNVAVRSSATAEDLPDMSFAGQQDTFLNVVGENALRRAVINCWSSLWTARAIGYRARNHILHNEVTLAVVVQVMIPSEAAGVLFTADPLTGRRDETVIDATLGLGEALVSGQVEPDHYVVRGERIVTKQLGAKALSIRGKVGGGTQRVSEDAAGRQALPDEVILNLARLGRRAADHFGNPQDVEWCWAEGSLWIVQSRPVTTLFPLPENRRGPDHLMVLMNFGAVQGIMDPITPLGRDVFFYLGPSMSRVFGAHWTPETQTLIYEVAERLFLDFNGVLRHPVGRKAAKAFLPAVEPGSMEVLRSYLDDPRLAVRESHWGLSTRLHLVRALAPNLLRVIANLLFPAARRRRIFSKIEGIVRTFRVERERMAQDPAGALAFVEHALWAMPPRMLLWLVFVVVSGQVAFQGLRRLAGKVPDGDRLALEVMRGLPHNVTTEMDLALWDTARTIRQNPASRKYFETHPATEMAAAYLAGELPPAAQSALERFMDTYSVRGVGEIDLGRARWREDPTVVMQSVSSYLQIEQPEAAPDAVFKRGAEAAKRAIAELVERLRRERGGWWKAPLARFLAVRARELAGLRELPKFTIIRIFSEMRTALLAAGAAWAAQGWLETAGDVKFLRIAELKQLAQEASGGAGGQRFVAPEEGQRLVAPGEGQRLVAPGEGQSSSGEPAFKAGWQQRVAQRRAAYQREQQRRQVPRLLMGDGMAVYEGVGGPVQAGDRVLPGSPVSPGQVEGVVHVVLDPFGARLAPGEILVCPGTDPAWTPLFLAAGGLVMEVGGLMTHGSVVAREYGIPAVVGVGQATQRLQSGMRVQVDGSAGTVTILD